MGTTADRIILHCDCNSFYASVECLLNPALWGVPMAVCGNPEHRHGIILAKNELAKKRGVQTAETIWKAQSKCPGVVLVPPHHNEYRRVSQQVNEIYQRYTDLVEPFGIDESWLDVTGTTHLFGDGPTIADRLRHEIREEIGLTVSVGVSFNKVFAKLGSDYKKPDATTVFDRENFREKIWPLPVGALLYVGRSAQETLERMGVYTIGQLAVCSQASLVSRMGKMGDVLYEYANGLDDSPVRAVGDAPEMKSVGNGMTFRRNLMTPRDIRLGVMALSDTVATRLRRYGYKCATLQVMVRDPQFKTISRQRPLAVPTHLAGELSDLALEILAESWKAGQPIRMLTITGTGLLPAEQVGEQLSLFGDPGAERRPRREKLEQAMDVVRDKYGKGALSYGGVLGNDLGLEEGKDD